MNGIIPLYKPKGLTSHDCVAKIRRLLNIKKVGHTGTLDPNAEGVLPVCVGEATKIIPFVLDLQKEYIAEVSLGSTTTTEDADGEVVTEKDVTTIPTIEEVLQILKQYTGEIEQLPPMYSAVKINGKKLYEYAREGIEVERPIRKITIHEMKLLKGISDFKAGRFRIRVLCSKGTYIRTLCVTIGNELGYPAHMSALIRTKSDGVYHEDTYTFQAIQEKLDKGLVADIFLPVSFGLRHLSSLQTDQRLKQKVLQGQKLPLPEQLPKTKQFKMMHGKELLAIYEKHATEERTMKPVRVFNLYKSEGE